MNPQKPFIPAVADGYERESVYVAMQDGCRIAVDVLHPAKGGRRLDGAFPTVLHATPYRRSFVITGLAKTAAVYAEELADLRPGDLVTQYEVRAEVELGETGVREGLRSFLRAVPRDASHAGVALAADGTPSEEDIARVAGNRVHLELHPLPCRRPGT